jgi:diacylglycerol O-acyltransferase
VLWVNKHREKDMCAKPLESETFSPVDAAWLRMEKSNSMATITGIFMFDEAVDYQRYRETLIHRFIIYPRFRQRVRQPLVGLPVWEPDPFFSLDAHLHRVALPDPGDQDALQHLVSDLMSTQLDFSRPLWQIHFVENFGQGCAIIVRLHHCIADGIALMQVLFGMTDTEPDAEWQPMPEAHRDGWDPLDLLRPAVQTAKDTLHLTESLVHEGMETLIHPSRLMDASLMGTSGTLALSKLLLIGPDSKTIFRGKCGIRRKAAWSQPILLSEIKEVGCTMDATINDVLLAAVTGGLRRYLVGRNQPVRGLNIRSLVPVNLRPENSKEKFGNQFGLIYLSLPVGIQDPIRRLAVLKARMDEIKESPEALVAFGILNVIGAATRPIENIALKVFGMKATAVMTNVPGPRQTLYLAGKPIGGLMFWVPSPAELGLGVSIFSYAGKVLLGVNTDAGLVPDPENIIRAFHEEFQAMQQWAKPEKEGAFEKSGVPRHQIAPPANRHCRALTKEGKSCRNPALPGSTFCYVHSKVKA